MKSSTISGFYQKTIQKSVLVGHSTDSAHDGDAFLKTHILCSVSLMP